MLKNRWTDFEGKRPSGGNFTSVGHPSSARLKATANTPQGTRDPGWKSASVRKGNPHLGGGWSTTSEEALVGM
jgi:hypothetical protein